MNLSPLALEVGPHVLRGSLYLPDGVEPLVAIGQTMVAGESIIADLATSEPRRGARAE